MKNDLENEVNEKKDKKDIIPPRDRTHNLEHNAGAAGTELCGQLVRAV